MDDCDLEKLAVKPGNLTPAFHKNTLEYSVTVASDVTKINIDPLTSDSGASYTIVGSGGSKQISLPEGVVTDVKIDVSAEDGTTKSYIIHVKRLSAKDATLTALTISAGKFEPEFCPDHLEYTCLLPCDVTTVTLTPTAPDKKNVVVVGGKEPGAASALNFGDTIIPVQVTSADGSNTQVYNIHITRKQFPRFVKITDKALALKYECPITLCPLYRPISVKGSKPLHTYSAPVIDEYTKTSKFDPLSNMPLQQDWRIENHELDAEISSTSACVPLTYGGSSEVAKVGQLGSVLKKCDVQPKSENLKDKFKDAKVKLAHSVQVRKWEKSLQQIFDETDPNILHNTAKDLLKQYFTSLPKPGQSKKYEDGETPLDFLNQAAYNLATAIKFSGKQHVLHFELAMVLEERYCAEDMFGQKKDNIIEESCCSNKEAQESSKLEEALAVCKLHGVDASAPVSLQLKAIDEEFHQLVNAGQSGKADHVMGLYAWFSKRASQEGVAARKAADEESTLGQAFTKYMDSLCLDETKALYNFHVGRMLVVQGNYPEAVARLEIALFWNSQHQLSRFYLGLALALQKDGPGERTKEVIGYLLEAMEVLLAENSKHAKNSEEFLPVTCLHAENLVRLSNVHLLRGIVQLGKLLSKNPDKDAMSPEDIFHTAGLLASQVLPTLSRGDTYRQVEWILMDAHSSLLDLLKPTDAAEVAQRCERLSALIFHSTVEKNAQLTELQERTCQRLVLISPCSSQALFLLGSAQFDRYENSPAGDATNKLLEDAISSFKASISLEGKPAEGDPPDLLKEQQWWQAKLKEEAAQKKAEEAKKEAESPKPPAAAARGGGAAARGGAAAPRGRGAAAPATGRGAAARGGARGGAASRGGARGGAAVKSSPSGKTTTTPNASRTCMTDKDKKPEAASETASAPTPSETSSSKPASSKPAHINLKSYHPRLGLARALRAANQTQEAQNYYNQVIEMAPEIHDAYIEGAEMLTKTDPLGAVDMYCKFPVPKEPSFDDAYIFGEIIRLLMKQEKYDDPRLGPNMIAYGRVLGLSSLEKYVKKLEDVFKPELLKSVYAGVNNKSVDDPDLQPFFKMKCWI